MSADPRAAEPGLWHEALRVADKEARIDEDAWMATSAVGILETRLARANADRIALREAVRVRDVLLAEQRVALAERDRALLDLGRTVRRSPLDRLAHLARRARRLAGRVYRSLRR